MNQEVQMIFPEPVSGACWIGGDWIEGTGEEFQRHSPEQGRIVWSGRWATQTETRQAVAAARQATRDWAEKKLDDRIDCCRKFAQLVQQRAEELATLIALEVGKPLWEARTEVSAVIGKVENSIEAILKRRWTTMQDSGDFIAVTRFRPHGVMFVLGPFNFPAHIPGGHVIPAILAGNCVVFKPSEWAPATGQWLCQIWQHAGLPPGVINLVHGAAQTAQVALEDEVDGILFTGSYRVGAELHRALAGRPEKVLALELGGNNPLVIHQTSDLEAAAVTCMLSAYLTSGQRCTCTRRLIVSGKKNYESILASLGKLIPQIKVGLPFDEPQPFMGPLIHAKAAQQILDYQSSLVKLGGETIVSSSLDDRCPALLRPGLIAMSADAALEDGEHFGPVLTIQCAEDLDQAIEMAGNTRFGLSAGFLGDSVDDFHYFLHRVRAGVVNWNRQTTGASGKLPFGGVGLSGNHQPSGFFAADYCSYPVASLESHQLIDADKPLPGLDFMS